MNRRLIRAALLSLILFPLLFQLQVGAGTADDTVSRAGTLHLPIVRANGPWLNPLSAETWGSWMASPTIQDRLVELRTDWIRFYGLSWRDIQPEEGGSYNWNVSSVLRVDMMVTEAQELGITPTLMIQHSPYWATVEPTSCAAIRTDKLDDFATFMAALVARYSQPPFNVHIWEIGNEPDVDPIWVGLDSGFGCWGDIDDPFYGGRQYGEMLKVVTPAMRAVNPNVKVAIGGLLLDNPNTTNPNAGRPELFLAGILEVGGAPYFDILPYHDHYHYVNPTVNYGGNYTGSPWENWGGQAIGKPAFLRSILASYGVSKPLWLNETTLRCPGHIPGCQGDLENFLPTQARHLVRHVARTLTAKAERFSWYPLHGPGWENAGLLHGNMVPRPAFQVMDVMVDQIYGAAMPPSSVNYGSGLEGYRFDKTLNPDVDVVFATESVSHFASVPVDKFVAAYDSYGQVIPPGLPFNGNYRFLVGMDAIYLHRYP